MRTSRQSSWLGLLALLILTVLLTACGGATATTVPTVLVSTTTGAATVASGGASPALGVPATVVPATIAVTAPPASMSGAPTASRPATSATATSTAVPTTTSILAGSIAPATGASGGSATAGATHAATGVTLFTIVPDQSEASYTVNEKFANLPFPSDAVGKTNQVQGQIALGPDGKVVDGGKITVNVMSLTSDRIQRDSFIRMNSLESNKYPDAVLVITGAEGLNGPLSGTPTNFKLNGQMTLHGVTKPLTFDTIATLTGDTINGTATVVFKMGDFNIMPPQVAILTTSDVVKLEIKINAKKAT